ncbi:hypothetical protein CHS0354_014195 [Potamilus streckersoni]|uniref:Poly [ADP-ribose] polymerase n=1 Tax=Potamilus streckersoni TaxID=2493646 RepID=A0AAE0SZA6_9BIVA|nr:hypothetical protein CHS0354_014195 [Potamilus streckersoni]
MADISKRCVLIKGLPANVTERELNKCLKIRNLQVLKIHSHFESQTDRRWVILLPDFKAVTECIMQGSWSADLFSSEITVTPDYCSECIVPDDWTQKEELSLTPILGAEYQTTDYRAQEKCQPLETEDDAIKIFPKDIYHHAMFPSLKSGTKPMQIKYTDDQSQTGFRENVEKDADLDSIQKKTTFVKKGMINLSVKRSPWFPVGDPNVKDEDFNQDRDKQRKIGPQHGKWHLSSTPSKEKVESDEGDEDQTEVYLSQHHSFPDIDNSDYTLSGSDIKDVHSIGHLVQEKSIKEKPKVSWLHEETLVYKESVYSSEKVQSLTEQFEQLMRFSQPDVEDKTTEGKISKQTTGISPQSMAMPEPQQINGRYFPNVTIPQQLTEVPSQNMAMPTPNMNMFQPHTEITRERQALPQSNIDSQLPNKGMPQPSTEVPVQSVTVPPVISWPVNLPFNAGQVYSATPTGLAMPGQVNSSGVTDTRMVPPGHAGPYPFPLQAMPYIPPGYQMNYGLYPWGHYGQAHLPPQPNMQHVPTTSQNTCPLPEASSMYCMPNSSHQFGTQPPHGYISGLEEPRDRPRSAASQAGPVEEDISSVNMTGKPQCSSKSFEQTKTIDRHERVTVEQDPRMRKRDDSDMNKDKPKLNQEQFPYNKDSPKNKGHPDRGNLGHSQIISNDGNERFKSHKDTSLDAQVGHIERGMNIIKTVAGLPSDNHAQTLVDREEYAVIKETDDASDYLDPICRKTRPDSKTLKPRPRSSAEFPLPLVPGVQKKPFIEADVRMKTVQSHDKSAVAEETESRPQHHETPRMIRVHGLAMSISKDTLELFFENTKKCGGGEIENLEWERKKGEAFITFKDPSVVQSVLEKQKRESFYLENTKLSVEEYVPHPVDPLRLFLKNLSIEITKECLSLYLEPRCRATPTEIHMGRLPGTALVTFSEPPDVGLLLRKVKEKTLQGQYVQVIRVPVTCCVQLRGLPLSTTMDTIVLYFENAKRSSGGPVKELKIGRNKQSFIITFENAKDAERVCMRPHTIDKKEIHVCLYYECLDDDLHAEEFSDLIHETEDTADELKLPDPIKLNNWNPQILRFLGKNTKHKNMFEKNLSDVNGVAKWPLSLEGYVIIECTVKVEDKNASLVFKDWTTRVINEVNKFAAGIEVVEFNLIQTAWPRVLEGLRTVTIDNPEDVGVFVDEEKHNIAVAGPKTIVEELKNTIKQMIVMVETKIALENNTVRETKKLKIFEIALLRMSHFNQEIQKMHPELQFDLDQKERMAIFVGQADIVQKVMVQMYEKLNSFISRSMQISKAAKDLLFAKETRKYIKQKMFSQKIVGVWDVVRRDEVLMYGRNEKEVERAIQLVKACLIENKIPLDEAMAQAIQGQQWTQLVQSILKKHTGKCSVEPDIKGILVVAVDDIFQDVFNEIKAYLDYHAVQETFLVLDPLLVKFIKQYRNDDVKELERRFEKSLVKLSIDDTGKQRGIKINGTKDGCKTAKIALAEMAKSVFTTEYVMSNKIGLKELLQGSRWRDQLSSIEVKWKCFIEMKNSYKSDTWQPEGASGNNTSGSDDDQRPKSMDWKPSSESAIVYIGGIRVSVIKGELAKQKVDVIVNSTSQKLDLNTGAISKTVLLYGGASIQKECLQQYPNGINPGRVVVTNGGNLSCTKVYHGCGGQGNSVKLMETFVCNCLSTADQSNFQSMAFPALGTGNLGFPSDLVGKLMFGCIKSYSLAKRNTSLKDILLVVYPSDINTIQAFMAVVGGTTVPSASIHKNASSSSNITTAPGMCRCTFPNSVAMEIVQGDITKETTDAIVNSVLSDLDLTKGQVSKAILTAGGPSIQQQCLIKVGDLKTNGFAITRAGSLPCKRIIHLVAQDKKEDWKNMIEHVLCQADKLSFKSVSFPALGTGGKGLSPEKIAQAMYSACAEFAKSRPHNLKQVRVVLFQDTMQTTFVEAIKGHSSEVGRETKTRKKKSSLMFSITTDSKSNAQSAIRDIESFVKSEIMEKEINSPREIISKLVDRQIMKMELMGQRKVMVSVNQKKSVILVSGAPKEVLDTYDRVMKYLRNIEMDKLKEAQEKLTKQLETSDLHLPRTWTQMANDENLKCVSLNPNDQEYVDVSQKFLASAAGAGQRVVMNAFAMNYGNYGNTGLTVIKIERVQNKSLYLQYKARKRQLEQQNNGQANEKELWHGTALTNIQNINHNGFNRSYSGSGSHGNGTYFAVNASYSVNGYCHVDTSGHRHIYLAHVMTGDSIVLGSGTCVLPPKDPRYPHITYNSTTDNLANPQMFVIFHDTQAYPSYHITFC